MWPKDGEGAMYIDETGGLWLAGPGGLVLALAALGLVLWAHFGLGMAGLVSLLPPRRSRGPGRRRVGYGRPPVERFGRPALRQRVSRPLPAAMVVVPVRGTDRQAVQWGRSEHDRDADLLPVA
jgi:hypothetical protein